MYIVTFTSIIVVCSGGVGANGTSYFEWYKWIKSVFVDDDVKKMTCLDVLEENKKKQDDNKQ